MDGMAMGTPWLDKPITLHSSRMYECSLNDTDLCTYQQGYWRFWYEADHRYALSTVAFFLTTIIIFAIPFFAAKLSVSHRLQHSEHARPVLALGRYLSYRSLRIAKLNWNSAPVGVLLLAAVGTIFFFCMTLGPSPYYWPKTHHFGDSPPLATRSGWMSLACLPFVFATSSKSNMITAVTGISHEKLQVFHRWISYAMYILALIHTFPFIVFDIWAGMMVMQWQTSVFYWTGVVALLAQTWLTFASFAPIRNLCYEWFKFSHFVAALVFVLFLFFHCDHTLTSWDYFIATGVIYSLCWLHSQLRIYFQHGIGKKATVSLTKNDFVRVSVRTKSTWTTGQHFFVRFPGLGLHGWTNHPFTACSLPERAHLYETKESELVFYIRPQGGFTMRLAKHAQLRPESKVHVLLDGPYSGIDMTKLATLQRLLVFAGGSGAGWVLPVIETFLRRLDVNSVAGKADMMPSMRVVLSTRDKMTRDWFEEAIKELLMASASGRASPPLAAEVHYTGSGTIVVDGSSPSAPPDAIGGVLSKADDPEKASNLLNPYDQTSDTESDVPAKSLLSNAVSVDYVDSRPNIPAIIAREAEGGHSSIGVFVCGPLSMQNDAANAVARQQLRAIKDGAVDMYLHTEHFSWA